MDKQELTITMRFQVEMKPGNPDHLHQVAKNYLRGKGVTLNEDNVIEV